MTATHQERIGAYKQQQRAHESEREMDKRALLTSASQLRAALDDGGRDMAAYRKALRTNQELWTIFQVAVSDPDSPLPRDLKITLLNLSRYVDRMSFRAVGQFMPQILTSLIEINRSIAAGLAKTPAASAAPSAYPTSGAYTPPPPDAMPAAGSVMTSA